MVAIGAMPAGVRAQTPHAAPSATGVKREVRGSITRAVGTGGQPMVSAWVTLHRVGVDRAGPLDSIRTDAAGRFAFRYRADGDTSALYFVSSRFAGIAYFTPPLRKPVVAGGEADLVLYDTTSAPVPIHVRGRHIVVMAPDSTHLRTIVEAYELSNDTSVTRVAGAAERPTFEAVLPDGARDPHATDGDLAAEAVSFAAGRVRVFAPLAPGVKQLSVTYHLAVSGAPITVASLVPVSVFEVLVEDAKGAVSGAGLVETAPAVLGGRRFRRFLAQDAPPNAVISILAPSVRASTSATIAIIVTAIGAIMLLALARKFALRNPTHVRARAADAADPEAFARAIAALDRSFTNLESPTAEQRADHYQARARLTAQRVAAVQRRMD
jgi:hypothetical protein